MSTFHFYMIIHQLLFTYCRWCPNSVYTNISLVLSIHFRLLEKDFGHLILNNFYKLYHGNGWNSTWNLIIISLAITLLHVLMAYAFFSCRCIIYTISLSTKWKGGLFTGTTQSIHLFVHQSNRPFIDGMVFAQQLLLHFCGSASNLVHIQPIMWRCVVDLFFMKFQNWRYCGFLHIDSTLATCYRNVKCHCWP